MFLQALYIFVWKHFKFHLYHWRAKLITFVVVSGLPMLIIFTEKKDDRPCGVTDAFVYMLVVNSLHTLSLISIVLLPLIEENATGVAEFLRIASKYSSWNVITFFGIQVAVSFTIYGAVLLVAYVWKIVDHFDMSCMCVLVLLYAMSSVALSFLLSVVFKEGKKETQKTQSQDPIDYNIPFQPSLQSSSVASCSSDNWLCSPMLTPHMSHTWRTCRCSWKACGVSTKSEMTAFHTVGMI